MNTQHATKRLRPVIRVFVSSTFSDMKHERNALEADAFPKLEQLCQRQGFQFQAIDLRWGVSTEAGLDHRTMRICFDELRRAQEISPRPNFLILLGNRYGWRPLPEEISVEEFHTLEHAAAQIPGSADKSAVAVLREWYREDTNAVPPVYLLQSRRQDLGDDQDYTHDAVWNQVQAVLWTIINRAMPPEQLQRRFDGAASDGSPPAIVRFQASATEQEIWHGALRVPDAREHVLAFFREIENLAAFSDPKQIKDFVDVDPSGSVEVALQTEQDRLKAELRQRLGSANVFRNEAPARLVEAQDNQGGRTADVTTDHLAQLCADVVSRLSEIIQGQIEEYWRNTAQASMDRAARELEIEQREYERFAKERGGEESFVGRQVELQAILDYVGSNSRWPLVIHGASGCGKTALLARASQEVAKTRKRIERFIGVAPRSSDLRSLLSSLCQELRQRNPRADALPTEIKELRDEFSQHLQAATPEQPLILFLDALDQLADADNGRLLNWLPPGSLPAHVKLVVSCLSDRATGDPAGQPYAELKRRQIPAENFINLDVLSEAEARLLLFDRWLPKAGRKVSDDQRARIEQRLASPACRQPIFLKLLFEEVQLWHSYDPAPVPGESVPALLGQLFDRLCQPTNHGPLLVNRVLGYLSASRHGLAENEILEILFADPEYRAKLNEATEQTRHELPPNAKRIPIALWSRLRFDLAPYLTERAAPGANVLTFYHRQVAEWVQEHFGLAGERPREAREPTVQPWQAHPRLAKYFTACAKGTDPQKEWETDSVRGFAECVFHLIKAGQHEQAAGLLSNFPFLLHKLRVGLLEGVFEDYDMVRREAPADDGEAVGDLGRLLPREGAHPPARERGMAGAQDSAATRRRTRRRQPAHDWRGTVARRRSLRLALAAPRSAAAACPEEPVSGGARRAHRGRSRARWSWPMGGCCRGRMTTRRCGCGTARAGRVWRCWKGTPRRSKARWSWRMGGCCRGRSDQDAAVVGRPERRVSGGAGRAHQSGQVARWSLADGRLLSWSGDKTLRLWDGQSGACLAVLEGHTDAVGGALVLADGRLLSWSQDKTLRLWDGQSGACLAVLEGHTDRGLRRAGVGGWAAAVVVAGQDAAVVGWPERGVSGGAGRAHRTGSGARWCWRMGGCCRGRGRTTLRLWDGQSGACLAVLEGHTDAVEGALALADGRLLSWSDDKTLRLWDGQSGACLAVLEGHTDGVEGVLVLADGRLLSWSRDKTLRLWDGQSGACLAVLEGHTDWVEGALVLADGRLLSWSRDKTLRLWDGQSGACLAVLEGHASGVDGRAGVGGWAPAVVVR